ncbi:exodeoxyribonuclease VII large subunit [Candidatus Uhrbacteria bacterium CG_4_9_14_3_um_filter_36_7]|uniref:Exodeoxyribonuclease 7 large subunit n=1 Tax=Candidatus Uhrbacteria bacterium CG_4_9_14_3_um_filter_36_7 TaxID=1975033 RepID=A0A2M7XGS6_9BACT|nr:MAG: exodeoxyribonuclease VII large subunit [Candidatus Uhrbacteria bacterium CG_4_9_14_3_um_filter_36_7]
MNPSSSLPKSIISVGEYLSLLNDSLRNTLSPGFFIRGEISDFRISQQKWISFDLKDEKQEALLKCFMTIWQLRTPLEDGMRVQVIGYPKIYERYGTFKLNVEEVELIGEGTLYRAYILLKQKLEEEGLFDLSRKRLIPRFPARVGLITSCDAAAYGDFLRVLNNRYQGVEIFHTQVAVQGNLAVSQTLEAFAYFNHLASNMRPDVLVLTRGGGGLEDLHAFNDERVARAIFQSKVPVICAVGHERDESLCDFVADIRASTPSNAAERLVPDRREIFFELKSMQDRLQERFLDLISKKNIIISHFVKISNFRLSQQKERLEFCTKLFLKRVPLWISSLQTRVKTMQRLLQQTDPKRLLRLGYSLVRVNGRILKEASSVDMGSSIQVELAKGSLNAEVTNIHKK